MATDAGTGTKAVRHAGSLYRRTFAWVAKPFRKAEAEAHHLHEIEETGESGETPYIAILGVFLFIFPIFLILLGVALIAYYAS